MSDRTVLPASRALPPPRPWCPAADACHPHKSPSHQTTSVEKQGSCSQVRGTLGTSWTHPGLQRLIAYSLQSQVWVRLQDAPGGVMGRTARRWQSQDLHPGLWASRVRHLHPFQVPSPPAHRWHLALGQDWSAWRLPSSPLAARALGKKPVLALGTSLHSAT